MEPDCAIDSPPRYARMPHRPGRERIHLRCEHLESRDAPAASVWDQQTFDDLAPGAIPGNWQQWTDGTPGAFGVTGLKQFSGTQSLAATALSNQTARIWNRDLMPADFALSGDVLVDSLQPIEFFIRGNNLTGDTPTYYAVSITRGVQVEFVKVVNGLSAVLASVETPGYFSQSWLRVTVTPKGNQFAVEIFRTDTNQYLNANGLWQA